MSNFKHCNMSNQEQLGLVGNDEYDITPRKTGGSAGLPPILNSVMVIARKRAREWLIQQPNYEVIYFSFDRTQQMYVDRATKADSIAGTFGDAIWDNKVWPDAEVDYFNDLTQKQARLQEAWHRKVNEEFLKVSDEEADEMWKVMVEKIPSKLRKEAGI